ncbi:MAG: hypothetical protein Q8J63_04600 [Candidatus Aquicultor sp.]|nr:hypothetical protein [Candidatus Aquicultor sp.]
MALRGKRPAVLVSMALLLMVVGLGLQGCACNSAQPESQAKSETKMREIESLSRSSKTEKQFDAAEEALTIKPTTETAGLYNAVKGADKVVISVIADIIDDREKETVLSSFNAQDPVFWDIMRAVTSANKKGSA